MATGQGGNMFVSIYGKPKEVQEAILAEREILYAKCREAEKANAQREGLHHAEDREKERLALEMAKLLTADEVDMDKAKLAAHRFMALHKVISLRRASCLNGELFIPSHS
jgi:hypothetical protein